MQISDEMVEKAARAMCEAWHYSKIGTPDGDAEWRKKQDQYRKQSRAALEAALSAQVQYVTGWRPIESAPRDGTTVLLYAPGWDSPRTGWTYREDDWQDCPYSHRGEENYQPTHWMPLPAEPAKQEGKP